MVMLKNSQCPSCGGSNVSFCFNCIDHSVSLQEFAIWACNDCTLRFTKDAPGQNEITGYYRSEAYVSHTDSQKGLINRIYHVVRNFTMQNKRRLVKKVAQKYTGSLLDIGAGTGSFLKTMKDAGWEVLGLEPDDETRERASQLHQLQLLPSESLFNVQQKYDVITMWHVLEHVHQLHEYLAKIESLLFPGGTLIIAVPNYTSFDGRHYRQDWAAYDVPRHLYHFSPKAMKRLLSTHGMMIEDHKPMWFDAFYVSMLTEKYKRRFLGLIRAMLTGAISNIPAIFDPRKCSSVIYIVKKESNRS